MARDEALRRKLESRQIRLDALRKEVREAEQEVEEYAARLLSVEHGLEVGKTYTFKSEEWPYGFRGRITAFYSTMDEVLVSNGYSSYFFGSDTFADALAGEQ